MYIHKCINVFSTIIVLKPNKVIISNVNVTKLGLILEFRPKQFHQIDHSSEEAVPEFSCGSWPPSYKKTSTSKCHVPKFDPRSEHTFLFM
jgi:hypothetical protein